MTQNLAAVNFDIVSTEQLLGSAVFMPHHCLVGNLKTAIQGIN